ncbi:hypothetical protein V8F06_001641 [Rhypophila decipiens]
MDPLVCVTLFWTLDFLSPVATAWALRDFPPPLSTKLSFIFSDLCSTFVIMYKISFTKTKKREISHGLGAWSVSESMTSPGAVQCRHIRKWREFCSPAPGNKSWPFWVWPPAPSSGVGCPKLLASLANCRTLYPYSVIICTVRVYGLISEQSFTPDFSYPLPRSVPCHALPLRGPYQIITFKEVYNRGLWALV